MATPAQPTFKVPTRVSADVAQHMSVFMPLALERLAELEENKTRVVHYTSAEVGLEILKTKTLWMRQASCMNDYSEVQHGLFCLSKAWHSEVGQRLQKILDGRFPGLVKEIGERFDAAKNALPFETFVLSLSEHAGKGREDEDLYGRLSMWRAYARGVGVALVINQDFIWTTDTSLGLFTTPVAYLSVEDFLSKFSVVVNRIETNVAYLDQLGRDRVRDALLMAFSAAAISTKHPGFREELEWRIVRTPFFSSNCPLARTTMTVRGVPQELLLLRLEDDPHGLVGIEPPSLVERVIIGPTVYPVSIAGAFHKQMKASGFDKLEDKITISNLPLRDSSA